MSYERCAQHNLMRCPMCKTSAPVAPVSHVVSVPPPAVPPVLSFNPEDLLDGPAPAGSDIKPASVPATPAVPDKQALEAIARKKAIDEGQGVEVNFGDGTSFAPPVSESSAKSTTEFAAEEMTKTVASMAFHEKPPFQIPAEPESVVVAAQKYARAKLIVKNIGLELEETGLKVTQLKIDLAKAVQEREHAKNALAILTAEED